jgi:cation-transporting ATPase 13A1
MIVFAAVADCLLLAGNCIVEEAVLTGESTPQWKLAVGGGGVSPNEHLHIKSHRQHVLFGGTKVLQHTGDKAARIRTPDGGCLAVVVRTGAMQQLLRAYAVAEMLWPVAALCKASLCVLCVCCYCLAAGYPRYLV